MVEAIEVHPSVQLQCFLMLRQLPTRMCLRNDISVTSSDAYIFRNIYLLLSSLTSCMHIHRPAAAKNNVLLLTATNMPIEKMHTLVAAAKLAAWKIKN